MYKVLCLCISAALFSACGGAPPPHDQMTSAVAAAKAAEVGGASTVPEATLQLKRANEEIERAKGLMANNDNEEAAKVLEKAQVDAELALALAKEKKAQTEAQQAIDQVQTLKKKTIE